MAFQIDLRSGPRLRQLPVAKITPNPYQPRRIFDPAALSRLAESIGRYGVITPLTVRKTSEGYLLIAGERRLRASRMAGLETVPCYIIDACDEDASAMALVENLQRQDLDFFEEAEGLLRLITDFSLTQQQAAGLMGKTQAAIANKLRLLKLAPETVELIRRSGLSERHARALLAIQDPQAQLKAAGYIAEKGLNVAQAEEYISRLAEPRKTKARRQVYIKDIRLFLNSVQKAVDSIKQAGIAASCTQSDKDGALTPTIVVDARRAP